MPSFPCNDNIMLMFYIKTKTHIGLGHGPASYRGNPVKLRYQAIICQHEMMSAEAGEETFFTMLQAERKWTTQGIDWFIKSFCVKDIFQRISLVKIFSAKPKYFATHLCRGSRFGWWKARSSRACCAPAQCSRNARSRRSCSSSPKPCSEHIFIKHFYSKYCDTQFC